MNIQQAEAGSAPQDFTFRGSASEFFGIWITNLLLSIVTLGIYSAWAKVRVKKYFYQNTYVAGRNFDYHATGGQIFIGRLIVVAGLVAYSFLSLVPVMGPLLPLALIAVIPWLIVRALRFNARMSSWSNVRFGFDGSAGQAFLVHYLLPVATALTFFLMWPFATRAKQRFSANGHRLGSSRFSFESGIGPFYRAFAIAGLCMLCLMLAFSLAVRISDLDIGAILDAHITDELIALYTVLIYAAIFAVFVPVGLIYSALVRNVVFNNTTLGIGHRFQSSLHAGHYIWIILSNMLVSLVTLGLMLPWAHVRMARYMASVTTLLPKGSLDGFQGEIEAGGSAIGDAYADIEGIDLGIAV